MDAVEGIRRGKGYAQQNCNCGSSGRHACQHKHAGSKAATVDVMEAVEGMCVDKGIHTVLLAASGRRRGAWCAAAWSGTTCLLSCTCVTCCGALHRQRRRSRRTCLNDARMQYYHVHACAKRDVFTPTMSAVAATAAAPAAATPLDECYCTTTTTHKHIPWRRLSTASFDKTAGSLPTACEALCHHTYSGNARTSQAGGVWGQGRPTGATHIQDPATKQPH